MGSDFNSYSCEAWSNLGASYPLADDRSTAIWSDFGSGAVPRNVILDSDGVVVYNSTGFNEGAITAVLDELLSANGLDEISQQPNRPVLTANYPNPFNAGTQIQFEMPDPLSIQMDIYNEKGIVVKHLINTRVGRGPHEVFWNGRDNNGLSLPSGVYVVSLITPTSQSSRKVLLLK